MNEWHKESCLKSTLTKEHLLLLLRCLLIDIKAENPISSFPGSGISPLNKDELLKWMGSSKKQLNESAEQLRWHSVHTPFLLWAGGGGLTGSHFQEGVAGKKKTLKKKLYGPFLWMGFNCLKATATLRRQFTFYHPVPRNSWYSFYQPHKDERLTWPWSHSVVLSMGPLDWESSALTTWPLLHWKEWVTFFRGRKGYSFCININ